MSSTKNGNFADIADVEYNSRLDENIIFENEVKDKFMKYKSKNVAFFNEEGNLPQFTSLPEKYENKETSVNLEGFPKVKFKLLDELTRDSLQPSNISSFGCENKKINSYLFKK